MQRRSTITLLAILLLSAIPARAEDWRHKRTPLFVTTQGASQHRCRDGLAVLGEPQEIVCKFAYGPWDKDLEDEDVELSVLPEGTETWRRLGIDRTGKDGSRDRARGIHDLGGWFVFEIPEVDWLSPGRHRFRAEVLGDGSAAEARLWILAPKSAVVVFDIDGTITTGDGELTRELVAATVGDDYHPRIRAGAVDTVRARVVAGALPVYITARPDLLVRRTRDWLASEGLPPGPVRFQSSVAATASKCRTRRYKERVIRGLISEGLSVIAAYGNAVTDIDAYLGAGLDKKRIFIVGPHGGEQGTMEVGSYREHFKALER
jgi:hypothetical protein